MLFPTFTFILGFLPVAVIVYFLLAKGHSFAARVWLIAMSLIFYSWFNWSYFFIIAGSIIGNHLFAKMLYKKPSKWLLAAGIAANVALLGYFKYYDFMVENLNAALGTSWTLKHILL
ncbi:MAG: MBOAT family protein, partial [Lentisphaeria bacterium]|nr:MBOAT family protein [Lentisphaeria bacterium]